MSHLAALLRQVTRKSQHPNALLYDIQLARAKQKYLVREELSDGKEGIVELGAPEEKVEAADGRAGAGVGEGKVNEGAGEVGGQNSGVDGRQRGRTEHDIESRGGTRDDDGAGTT